MDTQDIVDGRGDQADTNVKEQYGAVMVEDEQTTYTEGGLGGREACNVLKVKENVNIHAPDEEKIDLHAERGKGEEAGMEKLRQAATMMVQEHKKRPKLYEAFNLKEETLASAAANEDANDLKEEEEKGVFTRQANLSSQDPQAYTSGQIISVSFYEDGDVTPSMLSDAVDYVKIALTACAVRLNQEAKKYLAIALLHSTTADDCPQIISQSALGLLFCSSCFLKPRRTDKSSMNLQAASTSLNHSSSSVNSINGTSISSELKRAWEYQLLECFFSAFEIPPSTKGNDGIFQKAEDHRQQLLEEYKCYKDSDSMQLFKNNPTFNNIIQGWIEKLVDNNVKGHGCEHSSTSPALLEGSCGCGPNNRCGCGCVCWPGSCLPAQLSCKPCLIDSTSASLCSPISASDLHSPFASRADRERFLRGTLDTGEAKPTFKEFLRLGQAVWLLHKLAFASEPNAVIVRVPRNSAYDPKYMQLRSVEATENTEHDDECVDFMALPGFTMKNSIIKAQVYLKRRPSST